MMFRYNNPLFLVFNAMGFARGAQSALPVATTPPPAPPEDPEKNYFYIVTYDANDKQQIVRTKIFDDAAAPAAPDAPPVVPAPAWLAPARNDEQTVSGFSEPALA